jgi:dimethylargininase
VRPVALIREVGDSFVRCVTTRPAVPPLDPVVARRQHAGYTAALEGGGFVVRRIPANEAHPDGCFIEDVAIVVGESALLTRPGHPSRRGEIGGVEEVLRGLVEIDRVGPGATLDGGDVLQVGTTVFVGVGRRTDAAGADAVERFCAPLGRSVVRVHVGAVLHLKSAMSALDTETVLVHALGADRASLSPKRVVEIGGHDPEAANVVRLADGTILVAAHHARTAELVASLGYPVASCEVSEFARADGGLTCLSLRLRDVYQA